MLNQNEGWVNSSTYAGKTEPYLTDNQLWQTKVRVYPLKDYILTRYPQPAMDAMNAANKTKVESRGPFIFLGVKSVPLAIELSQWGYDVSVMVYDEGARLKVLNDARRQAGLFKQVCVGNYMPGLVPGGNIVFAVDTLNERSDSDEIKDVLRTWLSNHHEVVCSITTDNYRYWSRMLNRKFEVYVIGATYDDIFLSITRK